MVVCIGPGASRAATYLIERIAGRTRRAQRIPHLPGAGAWTAVRGWLRGTLTLIIGLTLAGMVPGTAGAGEDTAPPAVARLAGQLLVATPEMPDPRFAKSVIYMVEHNADGAMGLVVNQPMGEMPLDDLLKGLGLKGLRFDGKDTDGTIRLHNGGPVRLSLALVLHSPDYVVDGTVVVDHGLALTAQPRIVEDIAAGAGPRQSLVAFGYAGWSAGQLEAEIAAGAWITIPSDDSLVFGDVAEKWRRAMDRHGTQL